MNTNDVNAHKLITCPYNPAHQIHQYRMQIHLEKCRKQYPDSKKQRCVFDATHIVNEVELDYHMQICPERFRIDCDRYKFEDVSEYRPSAPNAPIELPAEEDWGTDSNCTSYNPLEATANNPHIIKKIKGATKSERRKARMDGVRTYVPPSN